MSRVRRPRLCGSAAEGAGKRVGARRTLTDLDGPEARQRPENPAGRPVLVITWSDCVGRVIAT